MLLCVMQYIEFFFDPHVRTHAQSTHTRTEYFFVFSFVCLSASRHSIHILKRNRVKQSGRYTENLPNLDANFPIALISSLWFLLNNKNDPLIICWYNTIDFFFVVLLYFVVVVVVAVFARGFHVSSVSFEILAMATTEMAWNLNMVSGRKKA